MSTPGTTSEGTISSPAGAKRLDLREWAKHTNQVTKRFAAIERAQIGELPWYKRPRYRRWLRVGGWNLAYYVAGMIFYTQAEGWLWDEAVYFLVVSSSTVGYGDIYPSTGTSMIVTLFFIIFGLVVTFAQLSTLTCNAFRPAFDKSRDCMERLFPQEGIDIDGDGSCDFKIPRAPLVYYSKNLLPPCLVVLVIQILFSLVFCAIEPWDFTTAFFHCLVTAATVGYGAPTITTRGGRWWAMFHIIISVSLLSAILVDVDTLRELRKEKLRKVKIFTGSMDTDLMIALDQDGNGVDRFEFVFGMLASLDIVQAKEIEPFLKLFARLDVDSNGSLTAVDFEAARVQNELLLKSKLTPNTKAARATRGFADVRHDVRGTAADAVAATADAAASAALVSTTLASAYACSADPEEVHLSNPTGVLPKRLPAPARTTSAVEMDEESATKPRRAAARRVETAQQPDLYPPIDSDSRLGEPPVDEDAEPAHTDSLDSTVGPAPELDEELALPEPGPEMMRSQSSPALRDAARAERRNRRQKDFSTEDGVSLGSKGSSTRDQLKDSNARAASRNRRRMGAFSQEVP